MGTIEIPLIVLGIIIGVILVYLSIIIFLPVLNIFKQHLIPDSHSIIGEVKQPECRQDVTFHVQGTRLSGWLYIPSNLSAPVPCIVMSHGFGGTKDMLLESYALLFVESGMAVLT